MTDLSVVSRQLLELRRLLSLRDLAGPQLLLHLQDRSPTDVRVDHIGQRLLDGSREGGRTHGGRQPHPQVEHLVLVVAILQGEGLSLGRGGGYRPDIPVQQSLLFSGDDLHPKLQVALYDGLRHQKTLAGEVRAIGRMGERRSGGDQLYRARRGANPDALVANGLDQPLAV